MPDTRDPHKATAHHVETCDCKECERVRRFLGWAHQRPPHMGWAHQRPPHMGFSSSQVYASKPLPHETDPNVIQPGDWVLCGRCGQHTKLSCGLLRDGEGMDCPSCGRWTRAVKIGHEMPFGRNHTPGSLWAPPPDTIHVHAFEPAIDCDRFMQFDEQTRKWVKLGPVCIHLDGGPRPIHFGPHPFHGGRWVLFPEGIPGVCDHPCIMVDRTFVWDGPSGPALDTPDLRLASELHDIVCMKLGRYPISGYFARHRLYRDVALAQGAHSWRMRAHYAGLLLGNWFYAWRNRPRPTTQPQE